LILLQNDSALAISNPSGLNGRIIYSLFRSHAGDIWIGTDQGAQPYNLFENKVLPGPDSLKGKTIFSICENDSGDLIFGTYYRLIKLSNGSWSSFVPNILPEPTSFHSLLFDSKNNLWAGTSTQGLYLQQGSLWMHPNTFADNAFYGMCEDKYHKMWFFSANNLYTYNDTLWKQITVPYGGSPDNDIVQVISDPSGNIWVHRYPRTVFRYDGTNWIDFNKVNNYPGNYVTNMAIAPNGDIWYTAWDEGIYRFNGKAWKHYTDYNGGLASSPYYIIDFFPDGTVVAATWNGILSFFDGTTWTNDDMMKDSYTIFDMAIDQDNYIWLAASDLIKYKNNQIEKESPYNAFTRLDLDKNGHVWAGNDYWGLMFFDGETWYTYTTADGLASNSSMDILVDSKGRIWTVSSQGISVSDNFVNATPEIRSVTSENPSFPNPFSDLLNLRFNSDYPGYALIRFYSQDGRILKQCNEYVRPGENLFQYSTTRWPEGMVICIITTNGITERQKLIKIK
jgi:ligand-binding sensor domain-containing protein